MLISRTFGISIMFINVDTYKYEINLIRRKKKIIRRDKPKAKIVRKWGDKKKWSLTIIFIRNGKK